MLHPKLKHLIFLISYFMALVFSSQIGLYSGYSGSNPYPFSTFQCIKNSGMAQFTGYLAHSTLNNSNPYYIDGLRLQMINAKNSGLRTSLVYTICRDVSPIVIAKALKQKLGNDKIDRFWLAPHNFSSTLDYQCSWIKKYTTIDNCLFLRDFINQMRRNNLPFGIASNSELWKIIFGEDCNIFTNQALYWFPYPTFDYDPTLNNFSPFGGWQTAEMKLYSCSPVCGLSALYHLCSSIYN